MVKDRAEFKQARDELREDVHRYQARDAKFESLKDAFRADMDNRVLPRPGETANAFRKRRERAFLIRLAKSYLMGTAVAQNISPVGSLISRSNESEKKIEREARDGVAEDNLSEPSTTRRSALRKYYGGEHLTIEDVMKEVEGEVRYRELRDQAEALLRGYHPREAANCAHECTHPGQCPEWPEGPTGQ